MKSYKFDIAIIGGGPAGSTAALKLAGFGFEVCLIEKKEFPRETVCGEFLSWEVIEEIKSLNLYDEFLRHNPNQIKNFKFYRYNSEISAGLDFPAYGLKRSTFDGFLLNAARKKGAVVYQPFEIEDISGENNAFKLIASNKSRENIEILSKHIIAAYGKQNFLDKKLNRKFAFTSSGISGIKFHIERNKLKNFNVEEIRIYSAPGIYCGLNAVNDDLITLCFLTKNKDENIPARDKIIKLVSQNENFKNLFDDNLEEYLSSIPIYGTGNIYFGRRSLVENGIIMIGDSAGVIAPLAGDGIGMAIQSAGLAAEILNKIMIGSYSSKEAEAEYDNRWNRLFKLRLRTAAAIQYLILSGVLKNAGVGVVKAFPQLLPLFIKLTRNYL